MPPTKSIRQCLTIFWMAPWLAAGILEEGNGVLVDGGLIERFIEQMKPFISQEADQIDAGYVGKRNGFIP